ncbi:MAG TPA: hypothetical protein VMU09_02195 [Acidimicrobiales bacterium]|nr:hypothetical protein [Acidimicrobiales bacterium]
MARRPRARRRGQAIGSLLVKKLLILAVLIALGFVAAKRLREA